MSFVLRNYFVESGQGEYIRLVDNKIAIVDTFNHRKNEVSREALKHLLFNIIVILSRLFANI